MAGLSDENWFVSHIFCNWCICHIPFCIVFVTMQRGNCKDEWVIYYMMSCHSLLHGIIPLLEPTLAKVNWILVYQKAIYSNCMPKIEGKYRPHGFIDSMAKRCFELLDMSAR